MPSILVDADACPVKDDVYRIALRRGVEVVVVSGGPLRVPARQGIRHVRVKSALDAADDWIAEHAKLGDIVITADVPLAARSLSKGARVIAPDGRLFTEDSIGGALASRELMEQLRQMGAATGGPAPFSRADRARFLASLGEAIQAVLNRD
ncbi:MAG TPA: YaiI/YqxD family protein [Candidatus Polarisedimenticolaceae bacterium]|nr:YaiI/YqxD family protein [Candidatus Polarisedimenticolaceae bacterium]